MTKNFNYDVVILGAGPGGYVCAIRCAQLGLKTAIVEAEHLGGVCLNWGCIPTKALLRTAELYHLLGHADSFGLNVERKGFDLSKIVARSRDISSKLSKGIKHLLKKNSVDVYDGWAMLGSNSGSKRSVSVIKDGSEFALLSASKTVIASGARARELPGLNVDGKRVWSVRDAMTPKFLPESILILGSGAIGVEFASFYNALGVHVTLVELQDKILPVEDAEISTIAHKMFSSLGIEVLTSAKAEVLSLSDSGVKCIIESSGKRVEREFSVVLPAVGIVGNVDGYGLENTKVVVEKSHIVVDQFCRTAEEDIYAIGDVIRGPWLAHKASHEGVLVAESIAGLNAGPMDYSCIPGCTYSYPQIASIGLTEKAAIAEGKKIKVGRFPMSANGKALALGESDGLIKVIYDSHTGELLGAHMVGAEVTEMIQGFAIAKKAELTEEDLMHTIFPHPTLSEAMHEAVLSAYSKAIHI